MKKSIIGLLCRLLALNAAVVGMPIQVSHAGMIRTEAVAQASSVPVQRARIVAFLARPEVQAQLQRQGINADTAQSRVNGLTDTEVQQIASQLDRLPAGGSDFGGVLLIILVILLVTDLLGLTRVFPFIKPIHF